jgi:Fe-S cluster assembly protein SufB
MPAVQETVEQVRRIDVDQYRYGFETIVESEKAPKGLSEDVIGFISAKKSEPAWMLAWRLDAYRRWRTMSEPTWARVKYAPIDYQDIYYYAAPKKKEGPKSLDEIDPEILETYRKLGIPLREQEILAGVRNADGGAGNDGDGYGRVAVDAVFDSVSVATTFKAELAKAGVLFMPISEALQNHPDLVINISAPSCRCPTISSPPSIPRYFPTAPSSMCRRVCAARWSSRPISASMSAIPASSSAPSSSPTKAPM